MEQAYPSATVEQNPSGKPRKGAFEVTLNDTQLLYSKLDKLRAHVEAIKPADLSRYGPAKHRDYLPNPVAFLDVVTEALLE